MINLWRGTETAKRDFIARLLKFKFVDTVTAPEVIFAEMFISNLPHPPKSCMYQLKGPLFRQCGAFLVCGLLYKLYTPF